MTYGQIPFDTIAATKLYEQYVNDGDATALSKLVEQSRDLCSMHALRLANGNQDTYQDLVQEGMLRAYEIYRNRRYNPTKGSLFTLLNNALPRRMIDILRQNNRHDFTNEDCIDDSEHLDTDNYHLIGSSGVYRNGDSPDDIFEFRQQTIAYTTKRFPSLSIAQQAGEYVIDSILEGNRPQQVQGTLRTIFNTQTPSNFYQAVKCRFAAALAHKQPLYEVEALALVNEHTEHTARPEMMLVLGPKMFQELMYYVTVRRM